MMQGSNRVPVIALVLILTTFVAELAIPASAMDVSNAMGVHYEFDKGAYNPGDSGRLLLLINNDEDEAVNIYGANLNITNIGAFGTHGLNLSCPVWSTTVYPGGHACLLLRGVPLNVTIMFKIPVDAQPRKYAYAWSVEEGRGQGGSVLWPTGSGQLLVIRPGEVPPPEPVSPLISLLLSLLALMIVYPLVSWKSKKAARVVLLGIFLLASLMAALFPPLVPLLALLLIIATITWLLYRRRHKKSSSFGASRQTQELVSTHSPARLPSATASEPTRRRLATRRKSVLMIVSAPLIFILSGLFLANTVMYPANSLPYLVGEVLCFILAPMMLIVGITIFAIARHK
jgi:hypothetical protein